MILNDLVLSLRFRDKSIIREIWLSEAEMGGSKQSRILTQKIYIFLLFMARSIPSLKFGYRQHVVWFYFLRVLTIVIKQEALEREYSLGIDK